MWNFFKALFLLIGSFYIFEAAVSLMTYPSDLTFWGGVSMIGLLLFGWVELGIHFYKKFQTKITGE